MIGRTMILLLITFKIIGTNHESNDSDDCSTTCNVNISSSHDVENSKLGDEGFETPIYETFNFYFARKIDDDMFTNMHACKDEYPLVHGGTYDIRNYPY